MNCSRSTMTRCITPRPISLLSTAGPEAGPPADSDAVTVNRNARPSTAATSATTRTVAPIGDGATWSTSTRVPTVVAPASRPPATAVTVAASIQATNRGVASTGTSPEPNAVAVSPESTTYVRVADIPSDSPVIPRSLQGNESFEDNEDVAFLYHVAGIHLDVSHRPTILGKNRNLHFHRLQDQQRGPGPHDLPRGNGDGVDVGHHLSGYLLGHDDSLSMGRA